MPAVVAGVAISVNWAAGVQGLLQVDVGALDAVRGKLLPLILDVLRTTELDTSVWKAEQV